MAKSNTPVSSFGPEIMAVLKAGCEERKTFLFPDPKAAFRFMSRLNSLRAAMGREKHPDSDRVYRAGVKINREDRCEVIVAPRDSEFTEFLHKANVSVPAEGPPKEAAHTPIPNNAPDAADTFLSTLDPNASIKTVDNKDE